MLLCRWLPAAAIVLFALVGCSGSEETGETEALAVINGRPLTAADLDARLSSMSPDARNEFDTPSMLSALVDREVKTRVWAEAAREAGLDKTDDFKRMLATAEESILAELYSRRLEEEARNITDADLREAYERDKHLYAAGNAVRARQIVCDTQEKALEALQAVRGGMPFEDAVRKYSVDRFTNSRGGDLGVLRRDSAIPGLGVDPDFFDAIEAVEVGGFAGPIQTRMGYHVVEVLGKVPGEVRPFEEVKGQIRRKLTKERTETGREDMLRRLWKKYNVTINETAIKRYIGYPVTPEEFMRTIKEVTSSGDKITLSRDFVAQFPESKYAPYAQFLTGFVFSEELHNYVEAASAFEELLERYPDSKYAAAARWMLKNMAGEHPPLHSVEDVVRIASEAGGKEVSGD